MNDGKQVAVPDLKSHFLADLFPATTGADFQALTADIRINGLLDPIVLFEDRILDGRHRYRACLAAGVEPRFEPFVGANPLGFVISRNLHRRHLDESQRALIARKISALRQGSRTDLEPRANLHGVTQDEAARLLNVSVRSVKTAGKVMDAGVPVLVAAVERGEVSLNAAVAVAEMPAAQQEQIVARGEQEILAAAKRIRADKDRAVLGSSASSEWYTPPNVAARVTELLDEIELDPCWHPASPIVARGTFTADQDGLIHGWQGKVFLNPPYGDGIGRWIEKLCDSHRAGEVPEAVALLPARVDTEWFSRLDEFPRCFVRGRLTFANADNPAPFPSAVVYLGPNISKFSSVFGDLGSIFVRMTGRGKHGRP